MSSAAAFTLQRCLSRACDAPSHGHVPTSLLLLVQEFKSHCAPEETLAPNLMTMIDLRHKLTSLGIAVAKNARKAQLVAQLEQSLAASPSKGVSTAEADAELSEASSGEAEAVSEPEAAPPFEGAVVVKEEPYTSHEEVCTCLSLSLLALGGGAWHSRGLLR